MKKKKKSNAKKATTIQTVRAYKAAERKRARRNFRTELEYLDELLGPSMTLEELAAHVWADTAEDALTDAGLEVFDIAASVGHLRALASSVGDGFWGDVLPQLRAKGVL